MCPAVTALTLPLFTAASSSRYLTSKTYLLTSLEALRKLLTSKANLTLFLHPPLTSSINSLNRLESICVSVFFVIDYQLHANWVWRHGNHGIQEAAFRQPSSNLFYKQAADSIWNVDGLKKKKKEKKIPKADGSRKLIWRRQQVKRKDSGSRDVMKWQQSSKWLPDSSHLAALLHFWCTGEKHIQSQNHLWLLKFG